MKDLIKGSVVLMSRDSKLPGYGNPQCVERVCEQLGTVSLYGHNEHYKIHHISKIIKSPENSIPISKIEEMIANCFDKHLPSALEDDLQKLIDEAKQ